MGTGDTSAEYRETNTGMLDSAKVDPALDLLVHSEEVLSLAGMTTWITGRESKFCEEAAAEAHRLTQECITGLKMTAVELLSLIGTSVAVKAIVVQISETVLTRARTRNLELVLTSLALCEATGSAQL